MTSVIITGATMSNMVVESAAEFPNYEAEGWNKSNTRLIELLSNEQFEQW